ncbi:MAG: hypothetical protein F4114_08310 [Rhodospirillaceae bacterium]|nr:hypothetical protein [Rhodospirillaceae bacterium]MYI49074.1 hypothetical protein [Rhodospirillaceae bacterium]
MESGPVQANRAGNSANREDTPERAPGEAPRGKRPGGSGGSGPGCLSLGCVSRDACPGAGFGRRNGEYGPRPPPPSF